MLTLCPYRLEPISKSPDSEISIEHIIPHAMGGSDQFVLRVNRLANSTFGMTVDSDLIHDPQLRFVAASEGLQSRTGLVTVLLSGEIVGTGEKVEVAFNKSGIVDRRIVDHHRKDKATGRLSGIRGFDDQFAKDMERLSKSASDKRWEYRDHQRVENLSSNSKFRPTHSKFREG